jgi:hypothetical protein
VLEESDSPYLLLIAQVPRSTKWASIWMRINATSVYSLLIQTYCHDCGSGTADVLSTSNRAISVSMSAVTVHWRGYLRCFLARSRFWRSRCAAIRINIGVQLAKRASTEIVLSFDQVIVECTNFERVKVSTIVVLLVYSGLSR